MPAFVRSPLSRRSFIAGSAAALTVAIRLPALAQGAPPPAPNRHPASFIRIAPDGKVTFLLPTVEMGQGTQTGQAQVLAEELGVDIRHVAIAVPTQPQPEYRIHLFNQMRSVGSYGMRYWHDPLRRAAAQARMMLVQAAAERLGVEPSSLTVGDGMVIHATTNRRVPYGQLTEAAARLTPPVEPALIPASQRRYSGQRTPRVDTMEKITGRATFGIDVTMDGLLHGAVKLGPVYRAEVDAINDAKARAMPGVVAVVPVPRGAVVVAQSWWQAKQAADALEIRWKPTAHDTLSSTAIDAQLRAGLDRSDVPPSLVRGDSGEAFRNAARIVEADYAVPFLAHVCMEPITCTARATAGRIELWMPTQGHDEVRMTLERALQIPADQLFINTTFLGGGFGRKTDGESAIQAILASRAVGGRPVKVIWSREDDVQQGHYRQTMMARLRAALDAEGRITGMSIRVSGPQMGRNLGIPVNNNIDPFSLLGLVDMPYQVANLRIDHAVVDLPVPMRPWRSIAYSFTGFFLESFMDECARTAGRDPLDFRKAHLAGQPRMLAVLDRVAEMSGWSRPAPQGVSRGIAVVDSYGSPVAQVVELRMENGRPSIERVHAAIDCGRAINPGQVETQIQGSVIEALGAALRVKITLKDGRAEQSNFGDYPILRIDEVPQINVAIIEIGSPLGGVGEPGVPPLAPALVNAIQAANGKRVRALPVLDDLG
ncbi:MAG: xanthine dehydrogenase family protein molybdopterin-binding subunit [Methylobacterium sp.]|jgi:isoquinoline 1-oxidoreductase beta subunit|nr:xanthine dehydrogenase family protein molybdopterin-binding subunit [Methylobacterium sp.]MCA3640146.1 xanthine dehydrogenase family protein molybdopterin-binding subunit [Methylobacterium sp.]MCA3640228.1 xanthine dehydrogenase family protein molybdopterin-binding subunit [Methylobacterium sp.]MCA3646632.1 xanthine dehydrogenase family protein molybdopterin-binding subunit [Methylobacterium sp.]MCA3652240.1 xanthine dehydrogenase family protein molybdopterin-binding subunit [Methylobacteriu